MSWAAAIRVSTSHSKLTLLISEKVSYQQVHRGGSLVVSEQLDDQTLLLPMYSDLSRDDQDFVLDRFREVLDELVPREVARS